jgi:hypothetical protein
MSGRPQELNRLATILGAADLAHQAIFDIHRDLLGHGRAPAESTGLLAESAQIATADLPRLTAHLRRLAARWDEESLLDPVAAADTLALFTHDLASVEPELASLLRRQGEIAARLRALLAS